MMPVRLTEKIFARPYRTLSEGAEPSIVWFRAVKRTRHWLKEQGVVNGW